MPTFPKIETADRLSRSRARMVLVLAVIFISQQGAFIAGRIEDGDADGRSRSRSAPGSCSRSCWLLVLATGGAWLPAEGMCVP